MTRPEYLSVVAAWPEPVRLVFGLRFNELARPGLGNYLDAERRAFEDVSARLAAGDFAAVVPPRPPTPRTSRRAPAPGQAGLGFEAGAKRGA